MKKALILSIKAGYGHHSTAQAIIDCLSSRGIEAEMLDSLEYVSTFLGDSIQDGYLLTTKYMPDIYGKAYDKLDKKNTESARFSPIAVSSKVVSKKLREYVQDYAPDVIIGTHSYACMLMTYMKRKGYIDCPTYGVVTDFTVHPFWENTDLDYYVVPDELLIPQMERKGIERERVLPFGIPIKEKFSKKIEKSEARELLGIEDLPTVLVMMGSMGFGNIAEAMEKIDSVDGKFQVLCVCGTNEKSRAAIMSREWRKRVYVYGFVDMIDIMMDASDCIITKPGGLTTSELMAKGLPQILVNPIPGQEDRNMEFLVNAGAAIMTTKTFQLDEALNLLMNNKWRYDLMVESVKKLGKPDSAKNLCEYIINKETKKSVQ